jgi:hypothetical protein
LNPKYVADEIIAKRQRPIFDQRLWPHRVEIRKRIKWEVLPRAIEDVDFKDVQLVSRFRAILSPYSPDNFNGIFELQMVFFDGFGGGNTLYFPRAILQNYEGCFPQDTHAAYPAAESNFLPHKIRKGFDEYALTGCGHPAKTSSEGEFCWSQDRGGAIQLPVEHRRSIHAVS